jgi:hypothetical protein
MPAAIAAGIAAAGQAAFQTWIIERLPGRFMIGV